MQNQKRYIFMVGGEESMGFLGMGCEQKVTMNTCWHLYGYVDFDLGIFFFMDHLVFEFSRK